MSEEQQRLRYTELSPEGVGTLRSTEHYLNAASGLDGSLLELVRLRVSQKNGCAFCIGLHRHELLKHHEPESRIAAVEHWRASDAFTHREVAALRWAEAVTDIQHGHASDQEFTAVQQHFSQKELVDLTIAIASINAWNRLAIAFRPQWNASKAAPPTAQKAGADAAGQEMAKEEGKVTVAEDEAP